MADPLAALRAYLLDDADVVAQVVRRVFVPELPIQEAGQMPRKAVVLSPSGGFGMQRSYVPLGVYRVDVRCYGLTFTDCWDLHEAVYLALKRLVRTAHADTVLYAVLPEGGPLPLRDGAAEEWPAYLSVHQVLADDRTKVLA